MMTLARTTLTLLVLLAPLAASRAVGPQDELAFPPGLEATAVDRPAAAPASMAFVSVAHIFFAHDKAELDARARRILDAVAQRVRHHSTVNRVLVLGHADEVGARDYNYGLADRRAAVVMDYLREKGVPAALFRSTGLGEDRPIDEAWTREGRRRNRHVEIYLIQSSPLAPF